MFFSRILLSNNNTGYWAGTVGTQRLLKLFKKYDIKSTWFIPGHSLETFPEDMAAVRDAGHEIGLHGYSHENPTDMSLEQQRDVLDKTYRMLTEFAGKPPRGSVAPWYDSLEFGFGNGANQIRIGGKLAKKEPSFSSTTASSTTTA